MSNAYMAAPARRVGLPDDIRIPFAPPLEDAVVPSTELIADAVRAGLYS